MFWKSATTVRIEQGRKQLPKKSSSASQTKSFSPDSAFSMISCVSNTTTLQNTRSPKYRLQLKRREDRTKMLKKLMNTRSLSAEPSIPPRHRYDLLAVYHALAAKQANMQTVPMNAE